ncbi:MAG TPA: hypothetical protein VIM40_01835, partial [Arthrobacter sp.]
LSSRTVMWPQGNCPTGLADKLNLPEQLVAEPRLEALVTEFHKRGIRFGADPAAQATASTVPTAR